MTDVLTWFGTRWRRFGLWRCRALGWHVPTYTGFDGASFEAKCSRCAYEGLIDSQGNLF